MPRTMIISDIHLPRPNRVRAAAQLEPLVEACDRLLINGDLAEMHNDELIKESKAQLDELNRIAERSSTELLLLSGNHDPEISPWRAAEFANGRILVTHGDAFHPTIAPWAKEARRIKAEWDRVQALHPEDKESVNTRFESVRAAALAEWAHTTGDSGYSTVAGVLLRPSAFVKILRHWQRFPMLARSFAGTFFPRAEWILVGHTHRKHIDRSSTPVVINTGAFGFPTRPLAVILEDDTMTVHQLKKNGMRWLLDESRPIFSTHVEGANLLGTLSGPHSLGGGSTTQSDASAARTDRAAS